MTTLNSSLRRLETLLESSSQSAAPIALSLARTKDERLWHCSRSLSLDDFSLFFWLSHRIYFAKKLQGWLNFFFFKAQSERWNMRNDVVTNSSWLACCFCIYSSCNDPPAPDWCRPSRRWQSLSVLVGRSVGCRLTGRWMEVLLNEWKKGLNYTNAEMWWNSHRSRHRAATVHQQWSALRNPLRCTGTWELSSLRFPCCSCSFGSDCRMRPAHHDSWVDTASLEAVVTLNTLTCRSAFVPTTETKHFPVGFQWSWELVKSSASCSWQLLACSTLELENWEKLVNFSALCCGNLPGLLRPFKRFFSSSRRFINKLMINKEFVQQTRSETDWKFGRWTFRSWNFATELLEG